MDHPRTGASRCAKSSISVLRNRQATTRTDKAYSYCMLRALPVDGIPIGPGQQMLMISLAPSKCLPSRDSSGAARHRECLKNSMIPAEALEETAIDRVVRIGVNVGDRQKIVDAALGEIDDERRKLASRIDIASLAFSPNGQRIVSGSWDDKTVKIWDASE